MTKGNKKFVQISSSVTEQRWSMYAGQWWWRLASYI